MTDNPNLRVIDGVLEATAEIVLTHVVEQAKAIISALPLFGVVEYELEYNDNNFYMCGALLEGMRVFFSLEEAQQYAYRQNLKYIGSISHERMCYIEDDEKSFVREEFRKTHFGAVSDWDITYADLEQKCQEVGVDFDTLIPDVYQTVALRGPFDE